MLEKSIFSDNRSAMSASSSSCSQMMPSTPMIGSSAESTGGLLANLCSSVNGTLAYCDGSHDGMLRTTNLTTEVTKMESMGSMQGLSLAYQTDILMRKQKSSMTLQTSLSKAMTEGQDDCSFFYASVHEDLVKD